MQKPDAQTQQRANELKEEVRKMLRNVDDHLQELNLIDAVQRLGVAYHFQEEIAQALLRMYKSGRDYSDNLHARSCSPISTFEARRLQCVTW